MWFFLLYDHVNIDVNVNININACRLWGTGYGFLIVRGIPMFVALWLAHKCTSPRTNIVWLNLSWYMYMIYFRNTVRYTTRRTYFCFWAISVLWLTSVFHLNEGEFMSETETVAWNIHSYFKNYQNHLFDIVTKVMEKMSELWKLSLLTDRQIDGQWTHKFIYTLTKVIFKIWLEQNTSVIKYYLNDNYFFEPRDFSYLPAHCSDT